jgi:hypothetical protein
LNVGHPNATAATIVGISGDLSNPMALNAQQTIYYPLPQGQATGGWIIVRSSVDLPGLAEAVRKEIRALDPGRPAFAVATYEEMFDDMISYPRFSTSLLGLFAGLALLLATLPAGRSSTAVTAHTIAPASITESTTSLLPEKPEISAGSPQFPDGNLTTSESSLETKTL